jgi:predicted aspartyl protease
LHPLITAFCLCTSLLRPSEKEPSPSLHELYTSRRYFELRDAVKSSKGTSAETVFYRGTVQNKFNHPEASTKLLQDYLKRTTGSKPISLHLDSYEMLADNYVKTYQYKKASETYQAILSKFSTRISPRRKQEYENVARLFGALKEVPAQTIRFDGDTTLRSTNKMGIQVPLSINGQSIPLIFDTGANLSVLIESLAKKLNLTLIDAPIDVANITGSKVRVRLGVASEVNIGNVSVRNAVFMVMPDRDMLVAPGQQLQGVIGFPVISALKEISFARNGDITIPAVSTSEGAQNLCMEGLQPLVEGLYRDRRLIFAFDTGAGASFLYPPFYKAYTQEIRLHYPAATEKVTGVGGAKFIPAFRAKDITLQFAGRDAHFKFIKILTEHTVEGSRYFYGNIGQDLIKQFAKMTLNFEDMSLTFE